MGNPNTSGFFLGPINFLFYYCSYYGDIQMHWRKGPAPRS